MNDIVVEKLILLGRVIEIAKSGHDHAAWMCDRTKMLQCFKDDPEDALKRSCHMQAALLEIIQITSEDDYDE